MPFIGSRKAGNTKSMTTFFILCGKSGAGKTSRCIQLSQLFRTAGAQVAGIVSPARFEAGRKTGILVQDIASGEQRRLAERAPGTDGRMPCGWHFDTSALQWGSDHLQAAVPCDVLIVDELGPLEIEQDKGWPMVWNVLNQRHFQTALITVRPSLLAQLQDRLPGPSRVLQLKTPHLDDVQSLSSIVLSVISQESR